MRPQQKLPAALFDALTEVPGLFEEPTCACFLAIDAALPSQAARVHLKYMHHAGKLTRVDLRAFARDNPDWAASILRSSDALQTLMSFPGQLLVYVSREAAFRPSFREGLNCLLLEMTFMLSIWERVLHRDGPRLGWIFQASVVTLRRILEARDALELYPFGRLSALLEGSAPPPGSVDGSARAYLAAVSKHQPPHHFEGYRAFLTTQLRALFHLALAVAPGTPWRDRFAQRASRGASHHRVFSEASPREHRELLDNLSDFLAEGLECPGRQRAQRYRPWLGIDDWAPPNVDKLYEGDDDWVRWAVRRTAVGDAEFITGVLREMNPEYHALESVVELAQQSSPKGDPGLAERLQTIRRSWITNLRQGPRPLTF